MAQLDVWGNEEDGFTVNDRSFIGSISVRTDRKHKDGSWSVSNSAIVEALKDGHYLKPRASAKNVDIDGDDDGILNVDDAKNGEPLYQLEYEKHHHEPGQESLFGEPGTRAPKKNPTGLSTGEMVAIGAAGVVVVGGLGYWLYSKYQASQQALQQQQQAPAQLTQGTPGMTPMPGVLDQQPPFIPSDVSGQVAGS